MARVHLFELEDQPWFPAVLRDAGTAYLRKVTDLFGQPALMAPILAEHLKAAGETRLVDLCSGGAGPVPSIVEALREAGLDATAVLTDRYPSHAVLARVAAEAEGRVAVHPEPVDATDVPADLRGCRTLFNALHHFRPADARAILESAARSRQPVAAFEAVERSVPNVIGVLFSPIPVALLVPFLRPFRWTWLLFTYLIPLIPLFVIWDGFVSCLRVYSVAELEVMVGEIDVPDYEWKAGRVRMGPGHVTYLVGRPTSEAMRAAG